MKTSKFQRAEWNTNSTTRMLHWRDLSWMSHHRIFYPGSKVRAILLPSSSASLFRAAYAFRIMWSGQVCESVFSAVRLGYAPERAWEDTVQGLSKSYITHRERIKIKPHTIPVDQKEHKHWKQNETYIIFYRGIALRFQKQTLGDIEMTMFACAHQCCRSILAKTQSKPLIFLKGNLQLSTPLLNSCGMFVCGPLQSFVVNVRSSWIVNCGSQFHDCFVCTLQPCD